jgi:hypothetical protein
MIQSQVSHASDAIQIDTEQIHEEDAQGSGREAETRSAG